MGTGQIKNAWICEFRKTLYLTSMAWITWLPERRWPFAISYKKRKDANASFNEPLSGRLALICEEPATTPWKRRLLDHPVMTPSACCRNFWELSNRSALNL